MRKLIISLLMVLAAVFCLQAGTLGDAFAKIRQNAVMVQDTPAEELQSEGLTAASVAMLDASTMEKALAAVPADLEPMIDKEENGNSFKAYVIEAGNDSEILLLIAGPAHNGAIYAKGSAEAVKKALMQ
ncbi:MAG: hypothetical protein K2I19_00170 [Muribaculaceae bacterium]|nr:hypothetical protein [Muribaculaceae bacterium]